MIMAKLASRLLLAASLILSGCASSPDAIKVRPVGVAVHDGPAAELVAYGRAQLALGSTGLALESFRKALRQQPDDAEALRGLGDGYEKMGRQDLARRYYEQALAMAPQDPNLLQAVGAVTEVPRTAPPEIAAPSGPIANDALVPRSSEMAGAGTPALSTEPSVRPSIGSIAVRLPPARPYQGAVSETSQAPRLERLSTGEVALVTTGKAIWQTLAAPRSIERALADMERRPGASQVPIRLLNAARYQGLAARTRKELANHGWRRLQIGDAPKVHAKSVILYPAGNESTARSLAAKLDVRTITVARVKAIVVLLGRDSSRVAARQIRA